jgi:hypothetical protein
MMWLDGNALAGGKDIVLDEFTHICRYFHFLSALGAHSIEHAC